MDWLPSLVEYLALDLLYAGGLIFTLLQLIYEWRFDAVHRMKSAVPSREKASDHENETVVARNKRPPHCTLRSFASVNL